MTDVAFVVSANSGAGNSAETARPAGYDATYPSAGTWGPGDTIVWALIVYSESETPPTPPPDFGSAILSGATVGSSQATSIWLFTKQAGASEPVTYGGSPSAYANAQTFVLRNCDSSAPFDKGSVNSSVASTSETTVTWTGVSPARNGSVALFIHAGFNSPAGAIGSTPTATERIDAQDGVNDAYTASYGTGDTGNRTASTSADSFVAMLAIFQPAGGAAPPPAPIDHYVSSFGMGCM